MSTMEHQVAIERLAMLEREIAVIKAGLYGAAGIPLPPQDARILDIVAQASRVFGVTRSEILGEGKHRQVAAARAAVCWVAQKALGCWPTRIGCALGNRDRSTIGKAIGRASARREVDPMYGAELDDLLIQFTPKSERSERHAGLSH